MKTQVLCVDDEPEVLQANALFLRRKYDVVQATSGIAALAAIKRQAPTVIISDMRMPGMDGATLLAEARGIAPHATRILLTGHADMEAAAAAVNRGGIFRFLMKPCEPDDLMEAVAAAVEQHRVMEAERVLLDQTLRGAVKAMADLLLLIDPAGFGRSALVKEIAHELDKRSGAGLGWQLEVAATFVHAGVATLPAATAGRVVRAARLAVDEQAMVDRLPSVVEKIIRDIPRLDDAAAIVAALDHTWTPDGERVPAGARILRLAIDAAAVELSGMDPRATVEVLRQRHGRYEPALLEHLAAWRRDHAQGNAEPVALVELRDLEPGMRLLDDLKALGGVLIVPRGTEVTTSLIERVRHFPPGFVVGGAVRVRRARAT